MSYNKQEMMIMETLSFAQDGSLYIRIDRDAHSRRQIARWTSASVCSCSAHALPSSWLDPGCVWTPLGEDYAGLNDRHALVSRDAAPIYLGRWDALMDGRIFDILPCLRSRTVCAQSSERLLSVMIAHHNLTSCRFPPVAFLQCCGSEAKGSCYKSSYLKSSS